MAARKFPEIELYSAFVREHGSKFDTAFLEDIGGCIPLGLAGAADMDEPFSLRREANAITAYCVRNTVLEDYHAQAVPIDQARMKALMIEVSTKLEQWLLLRQLMTDQYGTIYDLAVRTYECLYAKRWQKE